MNGVYPQLSSVLNAMNTVQLKVGDIVIPHFAHEKEELVQHSFSEGESQEHLRRKTAIV